jgi:hypothetical protein
LDAEGWYKFEIPNVPSGLKSSMCDIGTHVQPNYVHPDSEFGDEDYITMETEERNPMKG